MVEKCVHSDGGGVVAFSNIRGFTPFRGMFQTKWFWGAAVQGLEGPPSVPNLFRLLKLHNVLRFFAMR